MKRKDKKKKKTADTTHVERLEKEIEIIKSVFLDELFKDDSAAAKEMGVGWIMDLTFDRVGASAEARDAFTWRWLSHEVWWAILDAVGDDTMIKWEEEGRKKILASSSHREEPAKKWGVV